MSDVATSHAAPPAAAERWPTWLAAVATVLAAGLVLHDLGEKSLWFDEAFSIGIVDRPFGDALWRMAHWEVNQSPFYLALAGWWRLGQGETFLRLLAAASFVLAVPALHVLGRRLADARVGAVAAVLLAVHPLALQWGQQLRAYSLVLLLVIVATSLLLRAADDPDDAIAARAYAAVAALATYAHFFAGLDVASHGLWLLLHRPLPRRLIVRAGITYAVLVAPLAWFLVTREGDPLHWVSGRTGSAIVDTANGLTGGTRWNVLAYAAAVGVGLWAAVTAVRATPSTDHGAVRWRPGLPGIWLVAPVAAVTVSTLTVKPLLEARFLIVVVPALTLVAAMGLCRLGPRAGAALGVVLLVLSAGGVQRWYDAGSNEDWRGATRLTADTPADAPVLVEPWGGIFALRYYEDRFDLEPRPVLRWTAAEAPTAEHLVEIQSQSATGGRAPLDPAYEAWRDEHFRLQGEALAGGIAVRTYEQR